MEQNSIVSRAKAKVSTLYHRGKGRPSDGRQPLDNLLICFGAQKSGTTWLHAQTKHHPQIHFSRYKEVHFFDHVHLNGTLASQRKARRLARVLKNNEKAFIDYYRARGTAKDPLGIGELVAPINDDWYLDLFAEAKGKYVADFTPEYALIGQSGVDHVKRLSKDQRVVFIMREPLARSLSCLKYVAQNRKLDLSAMSESEMLALADLHPVKNFSVYSPTIKLIRKNFAPEKVKFMVFEKVMGDPKAALQDFYAWLDLDVPALSDTVLQEKVNATQPFKFPDKVVDVLRARTEPERVACAQLLPETRDWWQLD